MDRRLSQGRSLVLPSGGEVVGKVNHAIVRNSRVLSRARSKT